jgi:hypothetical protein
MLAAAGAVLIELQPIGIITTILLGGVIAFFAVIALKCNYRADIFFLGSHLLLPYFLFIQ